MNANKLLLRIKSECMKYRVCEEGCLFYKPDCDTSCAICKLIGENPMKIKLDEPTVTTTETIELPAKFDSIPNLKFKAENVYININGGED